MSTSEHWVVNLVINTDGHETAAQAHLAIGDGEHLLATGTVERRFDVIETDPPKELAAAAALAHLANRLRISVAQAAEGNGL